MPVPTQSEMHLPILETLNGVEDGARVGTIKDALVERFSMTEAELSEASPSGRITRFNGRSRWAIHYLKSAGLIGSPSRSHYTIVPAGEEFLSTHKGDAISIRQLKDLIEKRKRADSEDLPSETITVEPDDDITPDERIDNLFRELDATLADELLDSVKAMSPQGFERLVVDLLEKMDYGEGLRVGGSGDQGIDGVINQDPLGLEKVCIQAKRWQDQRAVGEPEIRNFAGSLDARGASKGVFITASSFNPKAKETARNISLGSKLIRLIDGGELAELMIRHNVGVVTEKDYALKKPDENYRKVEH